ncbi:MAG: OsmC family protein [Lentisphaeraceae bacterium]|nr:OsmC family protein [Lentisphaeraceae bacterium]
MAVVEVKLKRLSNCKFEAINSDGNTAIIDGPPALGGQNEGVRPMEMVLMGLAGCSSMDLLLILGKQRQNPEEIDVTIKGTRVDDVPAVYSDIHMHFDVSGEVSEKKLQKAVELSVDKYCSVVKMLEPTVKITHSCKVV